MLTGKINLDAIDESHLFNGRNGRYLDIVLFETPDDQYGNSHRIVQSVSKEARASGVRGPILGNCKIIGGDAPRKAPAPSPRKTYGKAPEPIDDDDVNF